MGLAYENCFDYSRITGTYGLSSDKQIKLAWLYITRDFESFVDEKEINDALDNEELEDGVEYLVGTYNHLDDFIIDYLENFDIPPRVLPYISKSDYWDAELRHLYTPVIVADGTLIFITG